MRLARVALIWAALAAAIGVPIALAATSELLAWRGPVYIVAGFAGIIALGLVLVQPLLIGGYLPGLTGYRGRRAHYWIGGALVVAVVVHVGGLWITSPPDMIDALTFTSPTPFSPFGVIAMWAIFAVALLAAFRRRLGLAPRTWRIAHMVLRGGHRHRQRGPRPADRGDDGDDVEGGALRAGRPGGHQGHGRPAGVAKGRDVARREHDAMMPSGWAASYFTITVVPTGTRL